MSTDEIVRQETKRHVMTLLVASHRALNNALDDLGFEENDDRVVEHDGRLAFVTCSHEPDCDDLFALIAELAARGENWELLSRIDGEGKAVTFHSRSEEHTSELQSHSDLVCRLLLEKKKKKRERAGPGLKTTEHKSRSTITLTINHRRRRRTV